jgi:hypothetical protein
MPVSLLELPLRKLGPPDAAGLLGRTGGGELVLRFSHKIPVAGEGRWRATRLIPCGRSSVQV